MKKEDLAIMKSIMDEICTTTTWGAVQAYDKGVKQATHDLLEVMDEIKPFIPPELFTQLDDAQGREVSANVDAAMLYGMKVMKAFLDAVDKPREVTGYIETRRYRREA